MVDVSCAALRAFGRGLARVPLARRRRGVVEADVLDRELADLAAGLLERELLAVDDVCRLRPRVALQRQARVDGQRRAASAAAAAAAAARCRCRRRRRRRRAQERSRGSPKLPGNVLASFPPQGKRYRLARGSIEARRCHATAAACIEPWVRRRHGCRDCPAGTAAMMRTVGADEHEQDGDQERVDRLDAERPQDDPDDEADGGGDDESHVAAADSTGGPARSCATRLGARRPARIGAPRPRRAPAGCRR